MPQKMMTQEVIKKLPKLYSQDGNKDAVVVVKFFCPWNNWTWYITEGEKEGNDWRLYGLVCGQFTEMGYVMLSELQSVRGPGGLTIERDRFWTPAPLSEVRAEIDQ